MRSVKTPRGGILPKENIAITEHSPPDEIILPGDENVRPQLTGFVIQNLIKVAKGKPLTEEFFGGIIHGIEILGEGSKKTKRSMTKHLKKITPGVLTDKNIISMTQLARCDQVTTMPFGYMGFDHDSIIVPDAQTIKNFRELTERSQRFFSGGNEIDFFDVGLMYGSIGGIIDFITADGIWDLKVSKNKPNKDSFFQVLIYFQLVKNRFPELAEKIKKVGIYNPRLDASYEVLLSEVDETIFTRIQGLLDRINNPETNSP